MTRWGWAVAAAALAGTACNDFEWGPEQLGKGEMSQPVRELTLGRQVYGTYCVGCHGEAGDGNGPAARFLNPKPRDFRVGRIKFAAVASGEAPRDADYDRIISHGLSGTAMPSFALLSVQERQAVILYLRTFNPAWKEETPGATVAAGKDPWAGNAAGGVAEGEKTYHGMAKCWSCHPAYLPTDAIQKINATPDAPPVELRPDLYTSSEKESDWGAPIRPPDFLEDRVKNGIEPGQLVQVITAGVGGTAMPMWAGALSDEQLWGLAYYVRSVALLRGRPEGRALKTKLLAQAPPPVPAPPDAQP